METGYRIGQKVRLIVDLVGTAHAGEVIEVIDIRAGGKLSLRKNNHLVHGIPPTDVEPVTSL